MHVRRGDNEQLATALAAARQDAEALRAELRVSEQRRAEAEARAAALAERLEAERRDADAKARDMAEVRERAARAEGESGALREQLAAERARADARLREAEAARDAVKAELDDWTAGGPLERALRALLWRRGRDG